MSAVDPRLRDFATDRQREIIDAVNDAGSQRVAAAKLGLSRGTVSQALANAKRSAARAGYSPEHDMTHPVAPGFHAKGVSTLYGADGKAKIQWVKADRDREYEFEVFAEALQRLAEPFKGKSRAPQCSIRQHDPDLESWFIIGDHHFGLLSWPEETGEDYDVKIAEQLLCGATDQLVSLSPTSETAVIVSVGDLLHFDGYEAVTKSGHHLDADSRWPKVVRCVIRSLRRCIEMALKKHKRVKLVPAKGNHDTRTSMMLAIALADYYANDPRVEVDDTPSPFHYHRFGANLIGVTHGDKAKPSNLPGVMSADKPVEWGQTKHRAWYTGHVHHRSVMEGYGCHVETFGILAAKDAWNHGQGYRADRTMQCIVLHKEHGEITRHTVGAPRLMSQLRSVA